MAASLKLTEGNGIAALGEPLVDFPRISWASNAAPPATASQPIFIVTDEAFLDIDVVAPIRPGNRPVVGMDAAEEERILKHPDVVAAIDATLPAIEAWERMP